MYQIYQKFKHQHLNDGAVDLMADAKDGTAKQEYAPRVISGELAFLIRSALNTAIYGEQGLGWKGYQLAYCSKY